MNEQNTKMLYEKYPEIFRQKDLSISQSCMAWGFEHGDGWFQIVDELCAQIMGHVHTVNGRLRYQHERGLELDRQLLPVPEAVQVKEKFGTLRFYVSAADDHVRGLINMAEGMSARTCETCGNPGKIMNDKGWVSTLCDPCRYKQPNPALALLAQIKADEERMRNAGLTYDAIRTILNEYQEGEISFGKLVDLVRTAADILSKEARNADVASTEGTAQESGDAAGRAEDL